MEALSQVFRAVVQAYSATRYSISLMAGIVALAYGGLWMIGLVPSDTMLAQILGMTVGQMLTVLYFLIASVVILLWYVFVQNPTNSRNIPPLARTTYRHTDISGLRGFNIVLIVLILISLVSLRGTLEIDRPVMVFLALMALIPLLFDLLPLQRPRRLLVPRDGETIEMLCQALPAAERINANFLIEYNSNTLADYVRHLNESKPENERISMHERLPLPHGMYIEIPPGS